MSLGLSKDSLADLQSLVQQESDNDYTKAPSSSNYFEREEDPDDDDDDLFFIEDDDEETQPIISIEPPTLNNMHLPSKESVESSTKAQSVSSKSSESSGSRPVAASPSSKNTTQSSNTGYYSGFAYHDDYYNDSYQTDYNLNKKKGDNPLCCLFPFLKDPLDSDSDYSDDEDGNESTNIIVATSQDVENHIDTSQRSGHEISPTSSAIDIPQDAIVTPSHGATVSANTAASSATTTENDKNSAVNPSTELPSPTRTDSGPNLEMETSDEEENISTSPKPPKGILKQTVVKKPTQASKTKKTNIRNLSNSPSADSNGASKRRSILPTYMPSVRALDFEDKDDDSKRPTKSVSFSPMARVMPVLARSEMSLYLKSMIWWQRNDYEDFRKAGRIIAKAMLQGGSEIWLETSNAWGRKQESRIDDKQKHGGTNNEYMKALKRYGVKEEEKHLDEDDMGSKWWCKFGHSRRGLEHIVSIEEGRQRQRLVNAAITAVLEEQRRQRISRRDHKKISAISMQYTSWAKDLALAAGEADQEAVRSNFSSKTNRVTILGKKLLNAEQKAGQPCASFILSANPALTAEVLDSHTHHRRMISKASVSIDNMAKNASSETKSDISQQAAGFQYREAPV